MKNIVFIMIAIFLLLGAFASPIADGIKGWRTEDTTENFSPVTTASVGTTANVTLTNDLFQDDHTEVIAITSNITGESPVATGYTAATNKLLVSALQANKTRTLTVNYYADSDSTVMAAIGPFLGFLIIGGLAFGIIWKGYKGR